MACRRRPPRSLTWLCRSMNPAVPQHQVPSVRGSLHRTSVLRGLLAWPGRPRGEQMTSGEIPPGVSTKGVVLVAHGGQASSTAPTSALQPAVLRMIPVAAAIPQGVRGSGAVVRRPRFRVRGWNGAQASPVGDLNDALDAIEAEFG